MNLTFTDVLVKLKVHAVDECSQTSNGTLGGGCLIHLPLNRLIRRRSLSWKATYWVKSLTHHPDGSQLTARQKLVLFVLADYHHEERGYAWVSVRRAAKESLTSVTWFLAILESLQKHGTLNIEKRDGKTHLYRFPELFKPLEQSKVPVLNTTVQARVEHTVQVQSVTKPSYPIGTDIQPDFCPADYVLLALEECRKTKKPVDDILKLWRDHPEERPI